jgi:PASTA domain
MTLDVTRSGSRRGCFALAALLLFAAVAVAHASDADARGTGSWTRTVDLRLSPHQLGLPASTSPRRLARAALSRSARRLGLPRSLAGIRLQRDLRVSAGPAGGRALRTLRYTQTARGRRLLFSQIDVVVGGGVVRAVDATVVPVRHGRPAARARISGRRALAIAHRAVTGRDVTRAPRLVAYAGTPLRGRAPRLAYVVETLPGIGARTDAPTGICVVVDARSGRVLTTWRGTAARPTRRATPRSAQGRAAITHRERIILLRDARVPSVDPPVFGLQIGSPYASWAATGNSFLLANWDPAPFKFTLAGPVQPGLETAVRNTKDVVVHMCFTRGFCSRDGQSDGTWEHTQVTGNNGSGDSFYIAFQQRVYLTPDSGYQNDVIAHELGHHITFVSSGDSLSGREQKEVDEGIADMFAYDFDREDATIGEDGPLGKNTAAPIRNWASSIRGQPFRMSQYQCTTDPHFNSTILSHAYFSFVQKVGAPAAGFLLYRVPALLGPTPTFLSVTRAFETAAAAAYPGDPQVAASARQAFEVEGEITHAAPACSSAAPPAPTPTPTPTPAPQVAVPNLGGDTPTTARSELSAAGLTVGAQTAFIDDTCNDIGLVVSQRPAAGTLVAPGTAVDLKVGQRPPHPCP